MLDSISPERDRYGRLLAHLVRSDGLNIAEEMVRKGFAYTDLRFENDSFERLVELQNEAIGSKAGLWKGVKKEQLPGWLRERKPGILSEKSVRE